MKAFIILGIGFGDEGKGITTDFVCCNKCVPSATVNIRFSSGQQAGHTVHKDDKNHIFASFGSGTFCGCPTYLTEHCTFYPPNMLNEYNTLREKGINPVMMIHPKAMCTTPYDVAYNRWKEKTTPHGSCGIGVGATTKRNLETPYKFYASDLMYPALMHQKLEAIKNYYKGVIASFYTDTDSVQLDSLKEFLAICDIQMADFLSTMENMFIRNVIRNNLYTYEKLTDYDYLVFEGSQGIMLDMEHGIFPNVTYAHTTSKNAMEVCLGLGMKRDEIEIFYVTRCYQTRHGKGWMSNQEPIVLINNEMETNTLNEWQGNFKVGEIDYNLLNYALKCDSYSWGCNKNLVVTCLDQRPNFKMDYSRLDFYTRMWPVYESHSCKADFTLK